MSAVVSTDANYCCLNFSVKHMLIIFAERNRTCRYQWTVTTKKTWCCRTMICIKRKVTCILRRVCWPRLLTAIRRFVTLRNMLYGSGSRSGMSASLGGVRRKSRGVRRKFEIWCPVTFVADMNFYQLRLGCQRSTRIDGGVSGRNKVGNR